ncbi:4-(cytidine 5'-diphospho)-2-C-methyl-D-erythritol kinase [Parasphingopyxis algicola]|uniref:4-(cytidine 5'-diphospho)-2-C-methyl-D-erythritol kinase n=1 Tax=Parasphingopyxis algicola TaxID=2026624 RepID=UPI0015A19585|nr:4-(cytidine 5'-diphospho)-2-C-methyl-D-erythritol kinase [Parasphingopyxis algicola]QLC24333.1 4-(cytidine 5'-diphospho)-2-C-methyl-D-erythritol kinase [Parasphingopyxis algicola]
MADRPRALRETAHAKINLALHVRERLPDGYHRIETLFAFCEDGDVLEAEPADGLGLTIDGPFADGLSAGDGNLVIQAAERLRAERAPEAGARIRLTKNLPIASGIGGGSADAAATLRLLTRLWDLPADDPSLAAIAARLGADVPACLLSRTCRGDGKGDDLVPVELADTAGSAVLLVNPGVAVPTGPVFAGWDGQDRGGLSLDDPPRLDSAWRNDLAAPARAAYPAIGDVLTALEARSAARFVRMSGSGATCFALFDGDADRDAAAETIARGHPGWWMLRSRLL